MSNERVKDFRFPISDFRFPHCQFPTVQVESCGLKSEIGNGKGEV